MFQASNQQEFDNWVRTIAIELIRQTPLDAVKYLDIFTLTPPVSPQKTESIKDHNHNNLLTQSNINEKKCEATLLIKATSFDENRNCVNPVESLVVTANRVERNVTNNQSVNEDEQTVEFLLKKCQNSDSYVPVKEKLKLFESLCRLGRISNDDSNQNNAKYASKRTRSLHDLSHSENIHQNNPGVKQICKYFETKNYENKPQESVKYNTLGRTHRTSFGPVKTIIGRKYSVQSHKH